MSLSLDWENDDVVLEFELPCKKREKTAHFLLRMQESYDIELYGEDDAVLCGRDGQIVSELKQMMITQLNSYTVDWVGLSNWLAVAQDVGVGAPCQSRAGPGGSPRFLIRG